MDNNQLPVRQEITVIEPKDSKPNKLGWTVFESLGGEEGDKEYEDYLRKILTPEKFEKHQYQSSTECGLATDRADYYRSHQGQRVEEEKGGCVWSRRPCNE